MHLHATLVLALSCMSFLQSLEASEKATLLLDDMTTEQMSKHSLHEVIKNRTPVSALTALLKVNTYDFSLRDGQGLTALELAFQEKNWPAYMVLLEQGNTLLHTHAMYGTLQCDLNFESQIVLGKNKEGHYCLLFRSMLNKKSTHGLTPLMCAVLTGNIESMIALIDCGADVNVYNDILDCSALSLAAHINYQERAAQFEQIELNKNTWKWLIGKLKTADLQKSILKELLDAGANKNVQDRSGKNLIEQLEDTNLEIASFIKNYQPQPTTRVYHKDEEPCCWLWEGVKMCYACIRGSE
ncbi:MAG: hypothetical protein H6679_03525 [Epsilonproteobacteria bacterium]|nr:hypothetical protein [Campylobacterota bacterium]